MERVNLTPADAEIILRLAELLDSETIQQLAELSRDPELWARFKAVVDEVYQRMADK